MRKISVIVMLNVFILVCVSSVSSQNKEGNVEIFKIADEMPVFPGGDNGLRKFISKSVKYPVEAQEQGIQGKVYINFYIDESGKVKNAKIMRSPSPLLNKESLRVIKSLPIWKPGKQSGKPVNVSWTVPITFALNGSTKCKDKAEIDK